MHDLLIHDEFIRYRKKELEAMARHIWQLMCSDKFEQAKGAMDLASMIIHLPSKIDTSDDIKQKTKEMIRSFEAMFIKILE